MYICIYIYIYIHTHIYIYIYSYIYILLFMSLLLHYHCYYTEFCDNSSTSLLFTHFQSLVAPSKILYYFVTQSNFEITVVLHYFKF